MRDDAADAMKLFLGLLVMALPPAVEEERAEESMGAVVRSEVEGECSTIYAPVRLLVSFGHALDLDMIDGRSILDWHRYRE